MSKTIVLKNAKFVESTFEDGSKQLIGFARGDSFLHADIPMDPNPRKFIGDINPNYTEMVKTLKTEPHMFARKNSGGITIFATSCDANGDGSYTLKLNPGDGIANGGHTYNALYLNGRTTSHVKLSIEIGLKEEDRIDIAEALNLARRLPVTTLQNKRGTYDWHKEALLDKKDEVIYHEGDSGRMEIHEELLLLNLFKPGFKTKTLDVFQNMKQSETTNPLSTVSSSQKHMNHFKSTLTWIARDVHEMVMYVSFNENYMLILKPFKKINKQVWTKLRGSTKEQGIVKGLSLVLLAGLASQAIRLNKNGIVEWKPDYKEYEARTAFLDELFDKIVDIVTVEEGTSSSIMRTMSIREKIMKHANLIGKRKEEERKRKNEELQRESLLKQTKMSLDEVASTE